MLADYAPSCRYLIDAMLYFAATLPFFAINTITTSIVDFFHAFRHAAIYSFA